LAWHKPQLDAFQLAAHAADAPAARLSVEASARVDARARDGFGDTLRALTAGLQPCVPAS